MPIPVAVTLRDPRHAAKMYKEALRKQQPSISLVRIIRISRRSEQGKVHHVGRLDALENEMISWQPGSSWSPNRIDALVWVLTELMTGGSSNEPAFASIDPEPRPGVFGFEKPRAERPERERGRGAIWTRKLW